MTKKLINFLSYCLPPFKMHHKPKMKKRLFYWEWTEEEGYVFHEPPNFDDVC